MDIRQVCKNHPYDRGTLKITLDGRDCGDICIRADADEGWVELLHLLPRRPESPPLPDYVHIYLLNNHGAVTSVHHGEVEITGELRETG